MKSRNIQKFLKQKVRIWKKFIANCQSYHLLQKRKKNNKKKQFQYKRNK